MQSGSIAKPVKRILRLFGWISLVALPLSGYLPLLTKGRIESTRFIWPPIGSIAVYASGVTAAFLALTHHIVTPPRLKAARQAKSRMALGAAMLFLIFYVLLVARFVKGVDTPYSGTQFRAVGIFRTEAAMKGCDPNTTDEDILRCGGLSEDDIEKEWTPASVRVVRCSLYFSYLFLLSALSLSMAYQRSSANG